MKLFENGVGRPSNEIKKKRKIFIASIVGIITLIIALGYFMLFRVNSNKLLGKAYSNNEVNFSFSTTIDVEDYSIVRGDIKVIKVKLNSWGTSVKQVKIVACERLDDCKSDSAWDNKFNARGYISKKNGTEFLELYTNSSEFKTYYLRISTYGKKNTNSKDLLKSVVYEIKPVQRIKNIIATTKYSYKWGSVIQEKWYVDKKNTGNKITLSCPSSAKVNETFKCTTNQVGVKISVGGVKALANGYSSSFKTTSNDKAKNIKYTDKLFKQYETQIKKDSNGKEYINAKISATKKGYKGVKKIVKIYKGTVSSNNSENAQSDAITLSCPSSAKVNEAFKCTTNQVGVKISVGGAKALASGYSSSFTTTSSDLTKDIKYTSTLFNGSWTIRKDSNGKEYIAAKVTAAKSGYKTITEWIKIYR